MTETKWCNRSVGWSHDVHKKTSYSLVPNRKGGGETNHQNLISGRVCVNRVGGVGKFP